MDTLDPAVLEEVLQSANGLLATRYLAIAAWICVVWDHLITFHQEVEVIWRDRKITLTKVIYVVNRYGAEICLFYVAYVFSGFAFRLSDTVWVARSSAMSL
ncbi:hypothetical protein NM688_g684 [Phlebia brevispora]|uniref:Uncharacterized protein n=1 Tax=Phlebia brevispora TaxID=194682 RepID=A0ACC1TDS3_9APHY|nr:hypothetical protein NM688_g684 [Phlebia brevispora]